MTRIITFLLLWVAVEGEAAIYPVALTCEYLSRPLGIDVLRPRLAWQFAATQRNQHQAAYDIEVSTDSTFITPVWKPGKINSSHSVHIVYQGQSLKSFTRYYWRVRIYDQDGVVSQWSTTTWFETAMLNAVDWQAQWIDDGRKPFDRDEDFYQVDRMPLFKRIFTAKKNLVSARLYISGLGYYEAYLNGKKIGDQVLDPGWTTYSKQVLYTVHDITVQLKTGGNTASIMLGNGWYNPLPLRMFSRFNLREVQETGRPKLLAEIHLHYADGTVEKILTDSAWLTAPGPVTRNNVYLGEHYDARLEPVDWLQERPHSVSWKSAAVTSAPTGELRAQMQPPVRITKLIKPISIKEIKPGLFIVDMGQNFAGVARIRVLGQAGQTIHLKYGEALHADGSLNFFTTVAGQIKEIWRVNGGPGSPVTAWQEDVYTLKGGGLEVWAPRFTFHGFRYIEISGWPGTPDINSIEGLRMNADLQPAGTFSCSNEMFNQLHEAIQWTFLSNVFSVQSDCPGREKMGYGADIVATAEAFMYNYDMAQFYRKAVTDFANDQRANGGITETAPYYGIADRGYGGGSGPLGWQLAFPFLQQKLFEFYGDTQIIRQYYPALRRQMQFLEANAIHGLYHWDISDHEALDPRPEAFTAACFYYHHARLAAQFAGILNKETDVLKYSKLAQEIKNRIVEKYLVPGTGRFDNATQSAQLFALWYELSTEKEKTMEQLMGEFTRHQHHVSAGIFGVKFMFDVLRENEQTEIAYRIANQRDFPGWGHMLDQGATTLWETWRYPDNAPSQNHPMFGSIDEWFYRSLLGINAAAPGFKEIMIKPQPAGDLTWAKGSFRSIHGLIRSEWEINGDQFTLHVSIPSNTTAHIWVPASQQSTISEGGKPITSQQAEYLSINNVDGYWVLKVGSGEYTFQTVMAR